MKFISCKYIFTILFFISNFASSSSEAARDNVLIIHSYHDTQIWTAPQKKGFDDSFSDFNQTRLFHEYLDAKRYPKGEHSPIFLDYMKKKYDKTDLKVIAISDDPALQLIKNNREKFFPNVPIVYLGINAIANELISSDGMTGVFETRYLAQTAFDIKVMTGSEELVIIADTTLSGQTSLQKIIRLKSDERMPKQLHIFEDLAIIRLSEVLNQFDSDVPILLIGQLVDPSSNNTLLGWNLSTEHLNKWTKQPIFTMNKSTLNFGAVGADEFDGEQHSKQASELIKQILAGTSVNNITPVTKAKTQWILDAEGLIKKGFDISNAPDKSRIINIEQTFYEEYKYIVWVVVSAFVVFTLIIVLLTELIRRGHNTRKILSDNEQRYKDLAHAGANVFWETDVDHNISYLSGDSLPAFGYTPSQIIGKSFKCISIQQKVLDFPWSDFQVLIAKKQPLRGLIFKVKQISNDVKIYHLNGQVIFDDNNVFIGYRGICKEITEEHQLTQKLAYQASFDELTGLINRTTFNLKLQQTVQGHSQQTVRSFLCFLDLDHFKLVNDIAGHLIGDIMLKEVSTVIGGCINENDILGRLGGDEFGLLIFAKNQDKAQDVCDKIISKVNNYKFQWSERSFDVGVSIGMTEVDGTSDEAELLSKVDLCCYKAKELGRGRVFVANKNNLYDETLQMGYIANITQAINRNQFYLVKQVIQPLSPNSLQNSYYEILIRFKDERNNVVSPGAFIPAAEKHGAITLIDQWVLTTVFTRYTDFFPDNNTKVSINLSGISLSDENFIKTLIDLVKASSINPDNICFEITETAVISQMERALCFINEMKAYGIKFALDDFGSGSSSFGYLKNLPVDYLKIDGSLITKIASEPVDYAIVKSIHNIAQMMGMKTIAEFVENNEIKDVLSEIGIDYVQGYGIGKPENCIDEEIHCL